MPIFDDDAPPSGNGDGPETAAELAAPDDHTRPGSKPGTDLNEFGWRARIGCHHYTPTEKRLQIEEIGRRLARSQTVVRISKDLGLPRDRVRIRIKQIETIWRESTIETREVMLAAKRAELLAVKRDAWEAWEESRRAAEVRSSSRTSAGTGDGANAETKASLVTKNQYGDASFLQVIRSVIADEAKLFGLNAPDVVGISWLETVDQALAAARKRAHEERAELGTPN